MNRIKQLRVKKGISQAQLARHMGWLQARISNYEMGKRLPNINDCQQLVKALNELGVKCSLDQVFPLDEAA